MVSGDERHEVAADNVPVAKCHEDVPGARVVSAHEALEILQAS